MTDPINASNLGQGLSHTRGPSHTAHPMAGMTSSGLHSAPPTNEEFREGPYSQNMNLEGF
jgi:hypothetical protein